MYIVVNEIKVLVLNSEENLFYDSDIECTHDLPGNGDGSVSRNGA